MVEPLFTGSCVALVTPFSERGVNEPVLRDMVRFHHEAGTSALLVCGSTGEAATMSPAEQCVAIEAVVDENGGRLPVLAGCGGSDTARVAELASSAREAGADAVLVSAPPYNKPTQRGLVAHFRTVLDAANLPLVVYNIPGRAGVNILPETILELAEDPRVVGVKEASGDISQITALAGLAQDRLSLWSGNDDQTLPILALGGAGAISVLANVVPDRVARMVSAFLNGDIEGARTLQFELLPLYEALFVESNPIPVKTALRWLGFDVGPLRLPLVELEEAARDRLVAALRVAGLERIR